MSTDYICRCRICNHSVVNQCLRSDCKCCTVENHSMVTDGVEGFTPVR